MNDLNKFYKYELWCDKLKITQRDLFLELNQLINWKKNTTGLVIAMNGRQWNGNEIAC